MILIQLERLIEWIFKAFEKSPPKTGHLAKWGSSSNHPQGSGGWKLGTFNVPLEETFRGGLIIGGSGSGKTVGSIIPSILESKGSLIIHDPSYELLMKTGVQLRNKGYEILVFNPSAPNLSSAFNPVERISTPQESNLLSKRIISLLYTGNSEDTFWNTSAESLLSMGLEILRSLPLKFKNLPNLYNLLNQLEVKTEEVHKLISRIDNPILSGNFDSYIRTEDKVRSGVLSTARSALSYLNDLNLGRLLGRNTITVSRLRKRKTALFIQTGTAKRDYFYLVTSLLFEQLFADIMEELPEPSDLPLHFILDEAASLSCPMLSSAMANLRKYRTGILLSIQDYTQFVERYGAEEANTIRSNAFSQFILPGASLETGKYYESLLGKTSEEDGNQPLITADRIRRLERDTGLLIQGNRPPCLIRMKGTSKRKKRTPSIIRDPSLVPPPIQLFDYSQL